MDTKSSKGKEIRIPGADHPITISLAVGKVRVTAKTREQSNMFLQAHRLLGKITEVIEINLMAKIGLGSASQPVIVFVEADFRAVGYLPRWQLRRESVLNAESVTRCRPRRFAVGQSVRQLLVFLKRSLCFCDSNPLRL